MTDGRHGLYYFAHPYTVKDAEGHYVEAGEAANFRLCCWRSAELLRLGFNIYSPIAHTHSIHVASPQFLAAHEHHMWYVLDNALIRGVGQAWDGIIMAPGWTQSTGCRDERAIFRGELDRPVFYYDSIITFPDLPDDWRICPECAQRWDFCRC